MLPRGSADIHGEFEGPEAGAHQGGKQHSGVEPTQHPQTQNAENKCELRHACLMTRDENVGHYFCTLYVLYHHHALCTIKSQLIVLAFIH